MLLLGLAAAVLRSLFLPALFCSSRMPLCAISSPCSPGPPGVHVSDNPLGSGSRIVHVGGENGDDEACAAVNAPCGRAGPGGHRGETDR